MRNSLYQTDSREKQRLKAQHELLQSFSEFFTSTVEPNALILDIGCGNGDLIMSRLNEISYKGVLGIDKCSELIEEANSTYKSDKNTFIRCNIQDDLLDNILSSYLRENNANGFDIIHIASVLHHLSDPVALLKKIRPYLKADGYLHIIEEEDMLNIAYPDAMLYNIATRLWENSMGSGDRHCGIKVPLYLKEAGFPKVKAVKSEINTSELNSEGREALWNTYYNYHLWTAYGRQELFSKPAKAAKQLKQYLGLYDRAKMLYDSGQYLVSLGFQYYIVPKEVVNIAS